MRSRARLVTHPIHPILIALPIGMWVGSWVFDLLSAALKSWNFANAGYLLAIGGCIGALLAAIPGIIDWVSVIPSGSSGKRKGAIHGILNTAALLVFAFIVFYRRGFDHTPSLLTLLLSTLGMVLIGVSGWLGGTLSYELQIGVFRHYPGGKPMLERSISGLDAPVCSQTELGDGQMMLVHLKTAAGSERVVLGRTAGNFYAFSDQCTHEGGPLCDGTLIGATVQCPWHGSRFDVVSGAVIAGPAAAPLRCYKTATRGADIYLISPASPEPIAAD
ncbi:MAG TPA: DUF2231 domain-containing protein [Acidisarcina sp.]